MKPHHHPLVKRARRRLELRQRTGRWRPDHLELASSGQVIHVDTSDPRGWEIIRGLGRGHQPELMALWARAIQVLGPTVAIDVGANYGEMLLSARYPTGASVYAIEPNPTVAACLRRSVASHPDATAMTVIEALASDDSGTTQLWVEATSSGSGSVSRPSAESVALLVQATTLDAMVANTAAASRLALKIDAEGWEHHVLSGAHKLLAQAESAIAIVEFEPEHLKRAGTDPHQLFDLLQSVGTCWRVERDGGLHPADAPPVRGCDLIAISDLSIASALGAP